MFIVYNTRYSSVRIDWNIIVRIRLKYLDGPQIGRSWVKVNGILSRKWTVHGRSTYKFMTDRPLSVEFDCVFPTKKRFSWTEDRPLLGKPTYHSTLNSDLDLLGARRYLLVWSQKLKFSPEYSDFKNFANACWPFSSVNKSLRPFRHFKTSHSRTSTDRDVQDPYPDRADWGNSGSSFCLASQ